MLGKIPSDMILFISGSPGAGKTTISYELLKQFNSFRIIQETDILREILRGYNKYIINTCVVSENYVPDVFSNDKLLSYEQAKSQCEIMKYSILYITERQKRKNIPTIINGVHIIPEILSELINDKHTKYINLFFDCEEDMYEHLKIRDKDKYGLNNIPYLFSMNQELQTSMNFLQSKNKKTFLSINIGKMSISETMEIINRFIQNA